MPTCIIITTWTFKPPDWGRPAALSLSPVLLKSEVKVGADFSISPSRVFHHALRFQPAASLLDVYETIKQFSSAACVF